MADADAEIFRQNLQRVLRKMLNSNLDAALKQEGKSYFFDQDDVDNIR